MADPEPQASSPASGRADDLLSWLDTQIAAGHRGTMLGSGYQATVERFETPYGSVVVKRPHGGWLRKTLGRRAIRHEYRAYERLQHVPGVPCAHGLLANEALVLAHLPSSSLRAADTTLEDRERYYARLLATVQAMHAAGVAHGDLKRKDNILVGTGEQPYIIDFGIAVLRRTPRGWWNHRLFAWVRQTDLNAWVKLKYRRRTENLSPADAALYRPLLLERLARVLRVAYQKVTLRRLRQRQRRRRNPQS